MKRYIMPHIWLVVVALYLARAAQHSFFLDGLMLAMSGALVIMNWPRPERDE